MSRALRGCSTPSSPSPVSFLTRPYACSISLVVQASLFLASLCASCALAAPTARQVVHQAVRVLGGLARMVVLPAPSGSAANPTTYGECVMLITWLRLAIAVLAPLIYEVVTEARLWQLHQAQRRRAGLPPEQGARNALYGTVRWFAFEDSAAPPLMAAWMLFALSWNWAVFLAAPFSTVT